MQRQYESETEKSRPAEWAVGSPGPPANKNGTAGRAVPFLLAGGRE